MVIVLVTLIISIAVTAIVDIIAMVYVKVHKKDAE